MDFEIHKHNCLKAKKLFICKTPRIYYGDSFQFVVLNYKKDLSGKNRRQSLGD